MRIALVVVLVVSSVAWANPPVAPPAKQAKPIVAPKPAERDAKKPDPAKLERRIETRRADAATSTLTLNAPKKKPARHVTLPDWTP